MRALNELKPEIALVWWNRVRSLRLQLLGQDHARTRAATLEIAVLVELVKFEGVTPDFAIPAPSLSELAQVSDDALPAGLSKHVAELEHNLLSDAFAQFTTDPVKTSATISPQQRATRATWLAAAAK